MKTRLADVRADRAAPLLDALAEAAWVRTVEVYPQCGSTNDLAREHAPESDLPLLVVSERQTRGRGRRGAGWLDVRGACALMTLAWRPSALPAALMPLVGLMGAVAAARAARDSGVPAEIKWPNDVWARDRKLGGVLAESIVSGSVVSLAVLGIGINVLAAPEVADFSPGAIVPAWMAEFVPGVPLGPYAFVGAAVARVSELLDERGWPRIDAVVGAARELDAIKGRQVTVSLRSSSVTGTAAGLDSTGVLVLRLADGTTVTVDDPSATVRLA